ncbi:hypothetical protein E1B28_001841 [Marasmius oreades]|uniref:Uncharacterized protein n=1 Tax=Marasmius oreades TaxID=181124 RepID=A0A9P7V485_9AGAR|nr:uncharacterized protein E1B28_001841 [Marasmius oreades]KAG7100056.1 hypothetical protein E1B28_001841 [Marasmius oreades]
MLTSTTGMTQPSPASPDSSPPDHNKGSSDDNELEYEQPLSLSFLSLKGQRAHEHDRQIQKQARDFAQMRARKGRDYSLSSSGRVGWLPIPSYFGYKTSSSSAPPPSEVILGLANDSVAHVEDWVEHGFGSPPTEIRRDQPRSFCYGKEAKLADLVTPVRKPRKRRETDFEFVPHIRSVIVLDDIVQMKDVSVVDEPWEHVGEDEKPTYANVVANSVPDHPL